MLPKFSLFDAGHSWKAFLMTCCVILYAKAEAFFVFLNSGVKRTI